MLNCIQDYNMKFSLEVLIGVYMKKLLQKISTPLENGYFASFNQKFTEFVKAHPELFCISLLAILCLIFLFFGLGFYPLMDVDETRYAVISRDLINSFNWNNLNLNSMPFLEKPPLYFWLVGGSIKLFGNFSSFAVRFPIAVLATFIVFFTYYVGKRVISRKYGVISALILLSSIFFLILSHIAILDMVLTVFVTSAIYCAFLTHFCKEENKKYYWWYFYLFIGLGFLSKGILAFIIPFMIILPYNFATKTLKEIFKPVYLLPGFIIFALIALPWHLIMYQEYGFRFVREYFLIHHFARFMNSEHIGRERPLLYFIPVFFLGFFPWSFVFIAFICNGIKSLVQKFKNVQGKFQEKLMALFEVTTNEQKMLLFASIYFVLTFLFFSLSSTKLPTYILPVFPAAAFLTGYYWWSSDEKGTHQKSIRISTEIFAALFIITAMAGTIAYYFLPYNIQYKLEDFKEMVITAFYLLGILLLLRLNTKRALSVFSGYIFTMIFVIALSVSQIFNFVYATGQNEIVKYSDLAQNSNSMLVTFDFAVKPSAMIDYSDQVGYLTDPDFDMLDRLITSSPKTILIIVKNKNLNDADYRNKINQRLTLIQTGERYSLYSKKTGKRISKRFKEYFY